MMDFSKENAMIERMKVELRKELEGMKFEDAVEAIIAMGMVHPDKNRLDVLCPVMLELIAEHNRKK